MRKSYFAIIALGALVIASCQKENSADLPKVDSPVFTATLDADSDTKTVLNGLKSEWVSGDAILVMNEKGDTAKYTAQNSGATATFKIAAKKNFTGTEFIAMYPASPAGSASLSNKKVYKLWLTYAQTAVEDGYDPNAHIAVAYTTTNKFVFKNVVALLKISVLGTGVQNISVSSASGEKIVGNFTCDPATGEVNTNDGINYYNPSKVTLSGTFTDGKDYYIAVLPGTYSEFSLSVNGITVNKKSSDVTFKRGKIYNLGSVRAPYNWGVVGGFNGWDVTSPALLYDTDGDGIYELKDQSLKALEGKDEGFKFVRVPDCSWSNAFGVHADFNFDTTMNGGWYEVKTNDMGNKTQNIVVSNTTTNWDIYIYSGSSYGVPSFNFTVLPTGSTTPIKQ